MPKRKFVILLLVIFAILLIGVSFYFKHTPEEEIVYEAPKTNDAKGASALNLNSAESGGMTNTLANYTLYYDSLFNPEVDPKTIEAQEKEIAEGFISGIDPKDYFKDLKVFSEGDVKLSSSDDAVAKRAYGNLMSFIISRELEKLSKTETSTATNVEPLQQAFTTIQKEILPVQVPKSAVSVHLNFLNSTSFIIAIANDVTGYDVDPVQTELARKILRDGLILFATSHENLKLYLEANNITFSETEYGYQL